MRIQNLQIVSSLQQFANGKINSGKGNVSVESDLPLQETNLPEVRGNEISPGKSSLSGKQEDPFQIIYPPFFPMGNTQVIYSTMLEAKSDDEPSDFVKEKKADKTDNTANAEVITLPQQVEANDDETVKNVVPQGKQTVDAGSVLDLTV